MSQTRMSQFRPSTYYSYVLFCQAQGSRDPEVDRRAEDVTPRHAAILMTSSSLHRAGVQRQQQQQQQQQHQYVNETAAAVRPVQRHCSCHYNSTLFPTGNGLLLVDKPEAEINRSRDGLMTSRNDWPGVRDHHREISKSGLGAKPAIEMTRQQVLHVYVLNTGDRSRTGNDVRDHVTPARRSTSDSNRVYSCLAVKSTSQHRALNSGSSMDAISDTVPSVPRGQTLLPRQNNRRNAIQAQPRTKSWEGEIHRPTITFCHPHFPERYSTDVHPHKPTRTHSFYGHDRHQPDVRGASLERTTGSSTDSSNNFKRKPPGDSFVNENVWLRPAYFDSVTLDCHSGKAPGKNTSHKVDHDDDWRTGGCFMKKKNKPRTLSVELNDKELDIDDGIASGCVGMTGRNARVSMHQRQNDITDRLHTSVVRLLLIMLMSYSYWLLLLV